jgi:hypothetical protein
MGLLERTVILVCTVLGTVFTAGCLYFTAAPILHWWPLSTAASAAAAGSPMIAPAWVLALFGLLGVALLLAVLSYRFGRKPRAIPTSLKIQFNAGNVLPVGIETVNIWRWYTLVHIIRSVDPKGKKPTTEHSMLTIFVMFDRPTAFKQLSLDAAGATLPHYEIKDCGPRHAIITMEAAIPGVVLSIKTLA